MTREARRRQSRRTNSRHRADQILAALTAAPCQPMAAAATALAATGRPIPTRVGRILTRAVRRRFLMRRRWLRRLWRAVALVEI